MKKSIHILVSGRVQGVFFRDSTKRKAKSLGVKGFVRNLENGEVEIFAEGEEDKLKELSSWCDYGPPLARVKEKRVEWKKYEEKFDNFIIEA